MFRAAEVQNRSAASCLGAVEWSPRSTVAMCQTEKSGKKGKWEGRKKEPVLILGVGGNKQPEKKSKTIGALCFMWLLAISTPG